MADACGFPADVTHQRWQVRFKVVPASSEEFLEKVIGPVGAFDFEAIAEYRSNIAESCCLHQGLAHGCQMLLQSRLLVMIENKPFGSYGRSLNLHSGVPSDEENHFVRFWR